MKRRFLLDTGPLVALLSARDNHHAWAKRALSSIEPPLLTCEAVMTESWHLLRGNARGQAALLELLAARLVTLEFALQDEIGAIRRLAARYADRPASLADVCLVRMSELHDGAVVITTDSDFTVYRRHGRQAIPLIAPFV